MRRKASRAQLRIFAKGGRENAIKRGGLPRSPRRSETLQRLEKFRSEARARNGVLTWKKLKENRKTFFTPEKEKIKKSDLLFGEEEKTGHS